MVKIFINVIFIFLGFIFFLHIISIKEDVREQIVLHLTFGQLLLSSLLWLNGFVYFIQVLLGELVKFLLRRSEEFLRTIDENLVEGETTAGFIFRTFLLWILSLYALAYMNLNFLIIDLLVSLIVMMYFLLLAFKLDVSLR